MNHYKKDIGYEFARRKVAFHNDKKWQNIKLWGLFDWSYVSRLLKSGELLTDMRKENKTIWAWPSEQFYKEYIQPQLKQARKDLSK